MKIKNLFLKAFPIIAIVLFFSCNHPRQVVPYDEDADEIYKPLAPNEEEESPEGVTFGSQKIPGFIFDYEIPTDKNDVYVFFRNFTILDINPAINQQIFDFSKEILSEYGFLNEADTAGLSNYQQLVNDGMSFQEASSRILEEYKEGFLAQVEAQPASGFPFNAYFYIYPVFLNSDYVTYRQGAYCYTGGAHGMTVSYLKTYDLSSGNVLSFDDIVSPQGKEEVLQEVGAHMAYSYPIYENITTVDQYIDSLNVWLGNFNGDEVSERITLKNYPLPDPAINKDGLVFVYQMYALTPGSDGCPVVLIPYKDIKGCLYPQFNE